LFSHPRESFFLFMVTLKNHGVDQVAIDRRHDFRA